jgi:UDP-glucose 4-epimerase
MGAALALSAVILGHGRADGDPPCLVADASRAPGHKPLGWRPARPDLATIVESAWSWHLAHPDGYPTTRV